MTNHKVLLICQQPLLCEGLERIFDQLGDVELIRLHTTNFVVIEKALMENQPHVVIIAGQDEDDDADHLVAVLLKSCQNTPIVWIGIEKNVMRVYSSHSMPASSNQLIAAIHQAAKIDNESTSIGGGDTNVYSEN